MEKSETILLLQKDPAILKDVSLLRYSLFPSQLYVLKHFVIHKKPLNIQEVYSWAIRNIYNHVFERENNTQEINAANDLTYEQLHSEGYGVVIMNDTQRKKASNDLKASMFKKNEKGKALSVTDMDRLMKNTLIKYNVKIPSYDKYQSAFSFLENLGIIYKRGKEGKGIAYALNPKFIELFKDKFTEIAKL